jgi:hypothetical protein
MTKADHIAAVVAEKDAEIARLNELLRSEGANRYWEGRWRDLSKVADALEAERDADQARVAELEGAMRLDPRFSADAIEAATIERCAEVADTKLRWQGSAQLNCPFTKQDIAAAIRALAKPVRPITDRTDPEGGIPGRT